MNKSKQRREEKQAKKDAIKHGNEPRYICPFPGCGAVFYKGKGLSDCCPYHRKFISDMMFVQDHVHKGEPKTPSGLVVPPPGTSVLELKKAVERAAKRGPNEA